MNKSKSYHSESGVALIMVLGMVAIIAAWAATATYGDLVSIRRISNIQDEMRATMASESAYSLGKVLLQEEYKISNQPPVDSLDEEWAQDLPPFPVDDGLIGVQVLDMNRYYNLNDLIDASGNVQPTHVTEVKALFLLLELDDTLVDALVDWLDKDDVPYGVGGAEDSAYYSKDYKIKNNHLDNWSELKLISGFTAETLKVLKTVAAVRPSIGATSININTAEPLVLRALFTQMTAADEEAFFTDRPYDKLTDAINNQTWKQNDKLSRLKVYSDAFMLRTHAMFGRANVREEYILSRNGQNVTFLSRERLGWQF
ncbi:MAG: type II secretion system minor pseudopilin GspK [Ghiorsea sp.]